MGPRQSWTYWLSETNEIILLLYPFHRKILPSFVLFRANWLISFFLILCTCLLSQNKDEYWLIQYQRLLNLQSEFLSRAACSVDPSLVFDLALLGVSHYAPVLSVLNCQSPSDYSQITDEALVNVSAS